MKSNDVPDEIGQLINDTLEGFMWSTDQDGTINGLEIKFKRGIIVIQATDTFNISVIKDTT